MWFSTVTSRVQSSSPVFPRAILLWWCSVPPLTFFSTASFRLEYRVFFISKVSLDFPFLWTLSDLSRVHRSSAADPSCKHPPVWSLFRNPVLWMKHTIQSTLNISYRIGYAPSCHLKTGKTANQIKKNIFSIGQKNHQSISNNLSSHPSSGSSTRTRKKVSRLAWRFYSVKLNLWTSTSSSESDFHMFYFLFF